MNYNYDMICDIINYIQKNCDKEGWNKIRVLVNNLPNKSVTYKLTHWNELEQECKNRVFDVALIEHLIEALFTSVFIYVDIAIVAALADANEKDASTNTSTTNTKTTTKRTIQYYFIATRIADISTLMHIIEKMFPAYISIPYHNIYYSTCRIIHCLEGLLLRLQNDINSSDSFNKSAKGDSFVKNPQAIDKLINTVAEHTLNGSFNKPLFIYKKPINLSTEEIMKDKSVESFNSLSPYIVNESDSDNARDTEFTNEGQFSDRFSKKLSLNGGGGGET